MFHIVSGRYLIYIGGDRAAVRYINRMTFQSKVQLLNAISKQRRYYFDSFVSAYRLFTLTHINGDDLEFWSNRLRILTDAQVEMMDLPTL